MADTSYPSTSPPPHLRSRSPSRIQSHPKTSTATSSSLNQSNFPRRSPPFTFPPVFPKISSSTFLVPSTAEGRPIPLDDSTAAHRTTALRQLSRSQPSSRQRYSRAKPPPSAKSSAAGTYSQPVVVRTYPGASSSSTSTVRGPISVSSITSSQNLSSQRIKRNSTMKDKVRRKGTEKRRGTVDARLPPLESFTFKSIIVDIQQDVGADLDRIAEICARTKYSLSNQYEVHIAPQGAGSGSLGPPSTSLRHHVSTASTLQAISSDDEHAGPRQRKRRGATRRRDTAYGTLETIMSSSRSSDEDRSNKKPAAQIIEEVCRATVGTNDESASANSTEAQASSEHQDNKQSSFSSKSGIFATAIMDRSRSQAQGNAASQDTRGVILLSGPAEPQTSQNHLETKTSPIGSAGRCYARESLSSVPQVVASKSVAAADITTPEDPRGPSGRLSGFSAWMPWKGAKPVSNIDPEVFKGYSSYAEGTLRELLRSIE
ncbi:uncharacterized protein F4812DRAFT_229618 [Daldinia caldariorum]|uniref:uncharacterized protein n=1 Tax=Daldinia caldariorum TaxID=326644 RepID=UPI002008D5B3|nr:uncharacterized protein F4812DRAFT_229618 [Daldinia caldariorum]KAI1463749.1 hypothetical protein F4812DRAFT_229618 [Daldinia caldariorum]